METSSSHRHNTGKRAKKAVGKRWSRLPEEEYYMQQTDKDIMFLRPNVMGDEMVNLVKRVRRVVRSSSPITKDHGWGSVMPQEIIHRVFQLVVDSEGAVPALCRLAQVCRLWHQVASSPGLWKRVSVDRCWCFPQKRNSPRIRSKIRNTIEELMQNRLSQVSEFSLHHWHDHIPLVLQSLASFCPLLTSLTLSHCSKVTADALVSVGDHCPLLSSLNLQNTEVDSKALPVFLAVHGSSLRCLFLTINCQTNSILSLLASGSCPELRMLEVNQGKTHVQVYAEGLQAFCPKLEVLRLMNIVFELKFHSSTGVPVGPGFSHLHELSLATCMLSHITDTALKRLLRDCTNLRVLDLRGCNRVTPECISELPCTDLESLYLNKHSFVMSSLKYCCSITRRYRHSLQELDLSRMRFSKSELKEALGILTGDGTNDTLKSLVLSGTKVSAAAVRDVLSGCQALTHLDLSSCRNVPRGLKCVYRGRESILQCLNRLSSRMQEEDLE
ncbi:F-box/LRR-repeat protein 6 [Anomaloglossus baeobatrachus]